MNITDLRSRVSAEIDSYRYGYTDGLVGAAWTEEKVRAKLQQRCVDGSLESFGVNGDAVGCFMAR